MIAGCKDSQFSWGGYNPSFGSSASTWCSSALVKALGSVSSPTYKGLLAAMRATVKDSGHNQTIMLSTNFEMDMDTPFAI